MAKDAQIAKVESAAPKAAITGEGKVTEAVVSGNDTKINTVGTKITVSKGATGVTAVGKVLVGGETVTIKPSNPSGGGSSGPRAVVNDVEFFSALDSPSVTEIVVGGVVDLFVNAANPGQEGYLISKPVTISSGASLRVRKWAEFHGATVTVQSGGTLYVDDNTTIGALNDAAKAATLDIQAGGVVEVNGELDIAAPSVVKNAGTIKVNDALLVRMDSNLGGKELLCGEIPGAVVGAITNNCMVDTLALTRAALDKPRSGVDGTSPYYANVFLMPGGSGESEVTLDAGFAFGAWTGDAVQQFIVFQGVTLTVPKTVPFTIGAKGNFHIQGTVNIEAGGDNITNNGTYSKASIGTLNGTIPGSGAASYTVETQEQWTAALADEKCQFINVTGDVENGGAITVTGEGAQLGGSGAFSGNEVTNSTGDENAVSGGWRGKE